MGIPRLTCIHKLYIRRGNSQDPVSGWAWDLTYHVLQHYNEEVKKLQVPRAQNVENNGTYRAVQANNSGC